MLAAVTPSGRARASAAWLDLPSGEGHGFGLVMDRGDRNWLIVVWWCLVL